MPADVAYGIPTPEGNIPDHLRGIMKNIQQAHTTASGSLNRARETQKKYYDVGKDPYEYRQGELVWCFLPMKTKGKSPKLQTFWTGPWTLNQQISPVVWAIQKGSRHRTVHVDILKPYGSEAHLGLAQAPKYEASTVEADTLAESPPRENRAKHATEETMVAPPGVTTDRGGLAASTNQHSQTHLPRNPSHETTPHSSCSLETTKLNANKLQGPQTTSERQKRNPRINQRPVGQTQA